MPADKKCIFVFDVDGTLTECGQTIKPETLEFLNEVRKVVDVALISGSNLEKLLRQFGKDIFSFNFVFAENGCVAYEGDRFIGQESVLNFLGEDKAQTLVNYLLNYISKLWLPFKRGTFIDFRNALINVSPVGRSCTLEERYAFEKYDQVHLIRKNFVKQLENNFKNWGLKYSIGGLVGFDIFPLGWDKSYCLKYLTSYPTIHFFGDKTQPMENDYEIFMDPRTVGHAVSGPHDTFAQVQQLLQSL